jgi:SPP1 family predicted phage head-tail adaptor
VIGALQHRITLQSPVETPDEGGGRTVTWSDTATVWARIESSAGKQIVRAGDLEPQTLYRLTIRFRTGVSAAMRVVWNSKTIALTSVYDPDGRARSLVLEGLTRSEVS